MNKIKLLCLALLVSGVEGQGQIYIDSYRFGAAAVSGDLLLNSFPNSEGAWSLRKLDKDYTGDCITIRRASNGDTTNIGFVDNYLDTATLKTFCSGTNCFVRRWYDQSGNGRNAVQTTDANQPTIATAGVIFYKGTTPSLDFDGTNDVLEIPSSTSLFNFIHNGTSSAIFYSGHTDISTANYFLGSNATSGGNRGHTLGQDPTHNLFIGVSGGSWNAFFNSGNNAISTNNIIISALFDADNGTAANRLLAYINGSSTSFGTNTQTAAISTSNANFNLQLGSAGNNVARLNGGIKEVIYYSTDQTSNRTAIRNNLNTFYSIY